MRYANNYDTEDALKRATEALSGTRKESYHHLPGKLQEVARRGLPCDFQFNEHRFRYHTKDETGMFRLYWLVTNAISGRQAYFYQKDYINPKTGKIRWAGLAKEMRKV